MQSMPEQFDAASSLMMHAWDNSAWDNNGALYCTCFPVHTTHPMYLYTGAKEDCEMSQVITGAVDSVPHH